MVAASRFTSSRFALIYCTCALALFALLSWTATASKSATSDEPVHALSAYAHLRYGDFRPEPDHPPLWKEWAALPWLLSPPRTVHFDNPAVRASLSYIGRQWPWVAHTLYRTEGNDPIHLVNISRMMMLPIALLLGIAIARFSYRAAGPVAACVAVTLFALDPNFLAHACLVKNDLLLALVSTALAYALWRTGPSLTWLRLLLLAILCAAAVNTKLNGFVAGLLLAAALLVRALLPDPWPVLGRTLATRSNRLLAAVAVTFACAVVAYGSIWAAYRFRFAPTPDPSVHFSRQEILTEVAVFDARDRLNTTNVTNDDIANWTPPPPVRLALFALDHHLFPEAYLEGFLHAYANSRYRTCYLLGTVSNGGGWAYFPIAFAVKTPLTTLATLLACALAAPSLLRCPRTEPASPNPESLWLLTCLALPVAVFGLSAAASQINIGLRHIFPVFPPFYIAAGLVAARLYAARPKLLRVALPLFAIALAAETLPAYPNYIPFFNTAAGGYRGGFRILGDSNLDWGQDLPLLAQWQHDHPDRTLYLAYFGTTDPWAYHIQYHNLPGGYALGPRYEPLPAPGSGAVAAVSATILQGIWAGPTPAGPDPYAPLRHTPPTEILGGSIYLFDLDRPATGHH